LRTKYSNAVLDDFSTICLLENWLPYSEIT
jgi:hypothetical protein